jgi:hypothetical protein
MPPSHGAFANTTTLSHSQVQEVPRILGSSLIRHMSFLSCEGLTATNQDCLGPGYQQDFKAVVTEFKSDAQIGLCSGSATTTEKKHISGWYELFVQFKNVLAILFLVATAIPGALRVSETETPLPYEVTTILLPCCSRRSSRTFRSRGRAGRTRQESMRRIQTS